MDITSTITGNFDVAQLALYLFWLFFAALVLYLQRENMRDGFPLISERTGAELPANGLPLPQPKTFKLPHGRGEVKFPDPSHADRREVAAEWSGIPGSSPLVPTGDPMKDGVGPAAWAERHDVLDLTLHGDPKIVPLNAAGEGWAIAAQSKNIIGWPVISGDEVEVGTVKDVWVDRSEALIRYIEIDLGEAGTRLAPFTLCRVGWLNPAIYIRSLYAANFADVPTTKDPAQVTMLEEEKISAFYCGGILYASADRQEPML